MRKRKGRVSTTPLCDFRFYLIIRLFCFGFALRLEYRYSRFSQERFCNNASYGDERCSQHYDSAGSSSPSLVTFLVRIHCSVHKRYNFDSAVLPIIHIHFPPNINSNPKVHKRSCKYRVIAFLAKCPLLIVYNIYLINFLSYLLEEKSGKVGRNPTNSRKYPKNTPKTPENRPK